MNYCLLWNLKAQQIPNLSINYFRLWDFSQNLSFCKHQTASLKASRFEPLHLHPPTVMPNDELNLVYLFSRPIHIQPPVLVNFKPRDIPWPPFLNFYSQNNKAWDRFHFHLTIKNFIFLSLTRLRKFFKSRYDLNYSDEKLNVGDGSIFPRFLKLSLALLIKWNTLPSQNTGKDRHHKRKKRGKGKQKSFLTGKIWKKIFFSCFVLASVESKLKV